MNPHKFSTYFLGILVVIIIALFGFWLYLYVNVPEPVAQQPTETTEIKWTTYTSDKYSFQIDVPETWQVEVNERIPGVHVYKKSDAAVLPEYLTHHSPFTHVSIYPDGIGTEGIQGQTASSTIKFNGEVRQAFDYVLKDGKRWATMVSFKNAPNTWEPWGYVWAGVTLENGKTVCVENGKEISQSNCEIGVEYENAETVWSGSFSVEDRNVQELIMASFRYLK